MYSVALKAPSVPASRPIIESWAMMPSQVRRSLAEMAASVGRGVQGPSSSGQTTWAERGAVQSDSVNSDRSITLVILGESQRGYARGTRGGACGLQKRGRHLASPSN